MISASLALVALLAYQGAAAPFTEARCKEVQLHVTGEAENFDLSNFNLLGAGVTSFLPTLSTLLLAAQAQTLPRQLVSGGQNLAGTFCRPLVVNSNNGKLQILIGTITGNREPWQAQGGYQPETYSWVDYMNKQGYATLALDRLGTGNSTHPDPLTVTQGPYEDALYHDLIQQIRAGTTGLLPQAYNHIIYVGNSFGSSQGAASAQKFPKDVDEYILTGFSNTNTASLPGILAGTVPLPGSIVNRARFGNLSPFYFATSSETGRTATFFGARDQVDFDDEMARRFYSGQDVVGAGDFLSTFIGPVNAPEYTGRVLVLTGEQDQIFCGFGNPLFGQASCGERLEMTGNLFPKADYNWRSVDKTGHAIQLHRSAPRVFDIAARFLAGQSFKGGAPA